MMHQFMELNDGTYIVHSDVMYDESGKELVEVYMEKPVTLGFKSAYCYLPAYKWDKVDGFDAEEMKQLEDIIQSTAHLIIRFARQRGLGNAANTIKINQCEFFIFNKIQCRKKLVYSFNNKKHDTIVVIGINPSKADDYRDDRTITRLKNEFSEKFGKLVVYNLFQCYSITQDGIIKETKTDFFESYIQNDLKKAKKILLAWGLSKKYSDEKKEALQALKKYSNKLICFKREDDEKPVTVHPSRIKNNCDIWKYQL